MLFVADANDSGGCIYGTYDCNGQCIDYSQQCGGQCHGGNVPCGDNCADLTSFYNSTLNGVTTCKHVTEPDGSGQCPTGRTKCASNKCLTAQEFDFHWICNGQCQKKCTPCDGACSSSDDFICDGHCKSKADWQTCSDGSCKSKYQQCPSSSRDVNSEKT